MPKKPPLVMQDSEGVWLAAPLAAKQAGVTKRELAALAIVEGMRFRYDDLNKPFWYAEPDIAKLAKARIERERKAEKRKKPVLSDVAFEAKHTREWKAQAKFTRYGTGGSIGAHAEK